MNTIHNQGKQSPFAGRERVWVMDEETVGGAEIGGESVGGGGRETKYRKREERRDGTPYHDARTHIKRSR